jgi:hypothetical protein
MTRLDGLQSREPDPFGSAMSVSSTWFGFRSLVAENAITFLVEIRHILLRGLLLWLAQEWRGQLIQFTGSDISGWAGVIQPDQQRILFVYRDLSATVHLMRHMTQMEQNWA